MKKIIFLFIIFCSCQKSTTPQPTTSCDPMISFNNQMKSIFFVSYTASGFHDGGDLPSLADHSVDNAAAQQIKDAVSKGIMPKNSTLSAVDKAAILWWIDS